MGLFYIGAAMANGSLQFGNVLHFQHEHAKQFLNPLWQHKQVVQLIAAYLILHLHV